VPVAVTQAVAEPAAFMAEVPKTAA
jgi:hypothetical protein